MKIKLLTLTLLLAVFALPASAQITTGEPSSKVIRTGNRPKAGYFGLYVGAKTDMFRDLFKSNIDLKALPLINFKYMASNHSELRLGLDFYSTTEKIKGDKVVGENTTSALNMREGNADLMFYPGWAYHFNKHNILDVYLGVEIPFGWNSSTGIQSMSDGTNYMESHITKRSFVIGAGAFVGLQAFIANLPIAIGLEYGLSAQFDTGLKYKHQSTSNGTTTLYYAPDLANFTDIKGVDAADTFRNLTAKRGSLSNQIRITFSYYFK